ncbi:hypothetical protein G7046_g4598 [Stylonectria norvegica]|nr:hypothetical protein G7046_g4598 [Stylonectria norvegica]
MGLDFYAEKDKGRGSLHDQQAQPTSPCELRLQSVTLSHPSAISGASKRSLLGRAIQRPSPQHATSCGSPGYRNHVDVEIMRTLGASDAVSAARWPSCRSGLGECVKAADWATAGFAIWLRKPLRLDLTFWWATVGFEHTNAAAAGSIAAKPKWDDLVVCCVVMTMVAQPDRSVPRALVFPFSPHELPLARSAIPLDDPVAQPCDPPPRPTSFPSPTAATTAAIAAAAAAASASTSASHQLSRRDARCYGGAMSETPARHDAEVHGVLRTVCPDSPNTPSPQTQGGMAGADPGSEHSQMLAEVVGDGVVHVSARPQATSHGWPQPSTTERSTSEMDGRAAPPTRPGRRGVSFGIGGPCVDDESIASSACAQPLAPDA